MRVTDVIAELEGLGPWVDRRRTRDQLLCGDPNDEVRGIAVCWVATNWAIERARAAGANLIITHENPFYAESTALHALLHEARAHKLAKVEGANIALYRCHDLWDPFPSYGVIDRWAEALQMPVVASDDHFVRVVDAGGMDARRLAQHIAERIEPYGESGVELLLGEHDGPVDPCAPIRRLGLGTGACTDPFAMRDLGADAYLVTGDGIKAWVEMQWAADISAPLFVVNHMTSEMPGMYGMGEFLGERFPTIPVTVLTCGYHLEHIAH